MSDAVIVGAKRTPTGKFMGVLSSLPAHQLGRIAIEAALAQAGIAKDEVSEVILGQVLVAGQGQNPARQAALAAGLALQTSAWGVDQVCGSGLRAVALAAQSIQQGDADIVVSGGQESMSQSMHAFYARTGQAMGAISTFDTMLKDGLTDAMYGYHMGITAEAVAERYGISRSDQDRFAARSHNLAQAARDQGHFAEEIAPVVVQGTDGNMTIRDDESIRDAVTHEGLMALRPVFTKNGSVTAGNSSPLNDGAAVLIVTSAHEAKRRQLPVLARIAGFASTGVDPRIMGIGPVTATQKALERAGWQLGDLELIEANEAFAAQSLAVGKELGWDADKVNISGGAIALGHPIGASGARVLTTLIYNLHRSVRKKGLATLCIGGGMGVAMCIEC